ncbi:MAG TPA: roadblock/LC7 domain-containing protein [bacterium]|nr:roadblock/LC7 domain-containing protein [bacterium]
MHVVDEKEARELGAFQAVRDDPKALERLAARGVRNFLLASGDGLLIDAVTASKTLDLDEVAAHAATALNSIRTKTDALSMGAMKGIVVEFTSGESVILDPMGDDAMAVYLSESPDGLAQLAREFPHMSDVATAGHEFLKSHAAPETNGAGASTTHVAHIPSRQPARPHAVPVHVPTTLTPAPAVAGRRVILRKADLETLGFTATAVVELALGDREAVGRAVGRNVPDQYLSLAAEATIRAVTEFLPAGYAVVLQNIQPVSSATEVAVWANVMFISPTDEQLLPGIARLDSQPTLSAAKTVLGAINRRLELALAAE